MSGQVSVHPDSLTLRELLWMAEGKAKNQWTHTSTILALIANIHRDPKKSSAFEPRDFNPFEEPGSRKVDFVTNDLSILKRVFVNKGDKT